MHKGRFTIVIATAALLLPLGEAHAVFQPKGHINNASGEKCTFVQTAEQTSYFHGVPGQVVTLVFDNPECMENNDINLMMINNSITRRYAQPDANFATRENELFRTSPLQVRGECIQSKTYPDIGVAVEYVRRAGHILSVKHGATVARCKD